ncbi:P-loop NTPase [Amycolatopsis sp. QT-25]|uniref:P-loop NTPase n=1 Tax=Amycolatopsis sp. QT-25 TaxID=3034022 RepID=UPI0023EAA214|nr:P-loop NTPase [Amycolatopsis sp. QT-25]WET81655.1 P-loop NTPase [Amycolatopsis sp. QT-25]
MTDANGAIPVIMVASGKGGVGKSSVAIAVARMLRDAGRRVGLIDADLDGPDLPRLLGLRRDAPAKSVVVANWVRPSRGSDLEAMKVEGLKVASVGFLLAGDQGFAVGAQFGDLMLARLIKDTDWGEVDVFVVDMPPGTGSVQQSLLGMVNAVGVLLVVTPAEIAHLDSGRALTVLRGAQAEILGGVENMAYLECPGCGERTGLHPGVPEERTIWSRGVPKLASLPFRPDAAVTPESLAGVLPVLEKYLAK